LAQGCFCISDREKDASPRLQRAAGGLVKLEASLADQSLASYRIAGFVVLLLEHARA